MFSLDPTRQIRHFFYGPSPGLLADRRLVKFCKQVIVTKKNELSLLSGKEELQRENNYGGEATPKTGRTSLIESLMRASSGVLAE